MPDSFKEEDTVVDSVVEPFVESVADAVNYLTNKVNTPFNITCMIYSSYLLGLYTSHNFFRWWLPQKQSRETVLPTMLLAL